MASEDGETSLDERACHSLGIVLLSQLVRVATIIWIFRRRRAIWSDWTTVVLMMETRRVAFWHPRG